LLIRKLASCAGGLWFRMLKVLRIAIRFIGDTRLF
jgi:hypothetical protein